MADVVGPNAIEAAVTKVTNEAIDSVWRQIGYVRNYKSNIHDLENQLERLKAERESMLHSEHEARRKGERIENIVTVWLKSADHTIQAAEDLLREYGAANKSCFMGCCPNFVTRHQFSRKAKKDTTPALAKVQQDRISIQRVSYPIDVQQLQPLKNYEALGSRMEIVEEILGALKSSDVNLIGVYGFPGVGKSSLVKRQVVAHVKEKNIFKVVAVANITHSWDLSKIQQEIADWLGLDFGVGSTEIRAARLFARLKQEEKVLIILDDIWEMIPLEDIGIPSNRNDHKGCKIIMTSRGLNILLKMGVQRHYCLEVLQQEEAWQLFETKAGDLSNSSVQSIATEVAKRCSGLPVLIVAVATSLRGKELCEWNDAFEQLRKFDHSRIDAQVYTALELSYKFLGDDAKSLLVLYAQLPSCMLITDLVKYVMGLDLFHNYSSVKAVRNRLLKVVNDLKKSCFLLEDNHELQVRIHDVVHSFVAILASKEHNVFTLASKSELEEWPEEGTFERCTAISLLNCKIPKLPEVLECPKLESFFFCNDGLSVSISENFFSRTKKLKLVGLLAVNMLPVLPLSLGFLQNLQTLCLYCCALEDISTIGELKKLRVLSLNASNIVQLPMGIRNLTHLQLLDLSRCEQLKVIPPGILNCLTKLEELCMLGSFVHWESEGDMGRRNNASLSELKNLADLINLEIHIMDAKMMPADLFHKKFERFRIFVGDDWYGPKPSKMLKLKLNAGVDLERVKVLLAGTEYLHLDDFKGVKNVLPRLERRGFPELKALRVQRSFEMEFIIDNKSMGSIVSFPGLEELVLLGLNKLKGICSGQLITSSFRNLKKLTVGNCNALEYLFPFSTFRCLIQLQQLDVSHCENLEMIVGYEDGDDYVNDETIKLIHLTKLVLQDLPRLVGFFTPTTNEAHGEISLAGEYEKLFTKKIQFPNLVELKLSSVKVKKILNTQCIDFCPFEKLTSLIVHGCGDLAYVLISSMVTSLAQLKEMEICDCKSMVEVISTSSETDQELVFPNLNYLKLKALPKVVKFCTSSLIRCPSLEMLHIEYCPRLQTFISSSHVGASEEACQQDSALFDAKVEFPKIEELEISGGSGLKAIWNDELHENSFHKLKYLHVESAKEVAKIFPTKLGMKRFQNLEILGVKDCDALTEVFEMGALVDDAQGVSVANTQLKQIWLWNLPNLKHIWRGDPKGFVSFLKLSDVAIRECPSLKTVFPASVAKGLEHLQMLLITDCGIEQIVAGDGEGEEGAAAFEFPMLKSLELRRLSQLKSFYLSENTSGWPALQRLCIIDCSRFQQSILSQEKIIPNLEELALNGREIEMICKGQLPKKIFHKLKVVELNFSDDYSNSFPLDILHMLDNLETLRVAYGNFKELFPSEGLAGDEKHQIISTKIHSLDLIGIPNLKTIWNEVLRTLESLSIDECGSLIILAPWSASFKCLTSLKTDSCRGLLSLVTSSTAKSLVQLKTLIVCNCNQVKVIVSDEGDETTDEITFIQLKFLELDCLPSLASFCSAKHKFKFPCLIDIVVHQCPSMEFFSKGVSTTPLLQRVRLTEAVNTGEWLGDLNSTISFCYRKMVGLHGMQHLKVSEYSNLKSGLNDELPVQFFCDLESLVIDEIAFSSYAVPSNLLESLNKLEKLEIINCETLEEVFDVQIGSTAGCGHTDYLSKLKEFHLINLPRLGNIWNEHPQGILNFKHLNSLKVHHCSSLKAIFTLSIAEGLVQLQEVEVKYCNSVEEIVSKEAGNNVMNEITFPLLQSVMLESLPALLSLNRGSEVLKFPSLEQIEIVDCPSTFTSAFLRELQSNAFDGTTEAKIQFPNLVELKLSSIKVKKILNNQCIELCPFENLTSLIVHGCGDLAYFLTSSMVRCLSQLKEVEIVDCKSMVEVISTCSETDQEYVFPSLNYLKLKGLRNVVKFCTNSLIRCPSLEMLHIEFCPRLRTFISTSHVGSGDEAYQQDSALFDAKVEFPNLEELEISGGSGMKAIWDDELHENSFHKLKYLNVENAKEVAKIFPSKLGMKRFQNLEILGIKNCDALTEVFEMGALVDDSQGVSAANIQLKQFWLWNLPNLKHVWREDPKGFVNFLKLSDVAIRECPSLKTVFPASVAKGLEHLQMLLITDCGIEQIVAGDGEGVEGAAAFEFPMLKSLELRRLSQLKSFYLSINTSGWPALQRLCIIECNKFQQSILSQEKIVPNLEELAFSGKEIAMIREGRHPKMIFHKLKVVELNFSNDYSNSFPFDVLVMFNNVETLRVVHGNFKDLFPIEGLTGDEKNQLIFTKIRYLELIGIPNMKTIWNEVLQTLESILVDTCGSLIILAPFSASFKCLTSLKTDKCRGLLSLFSCSTAKSLVQLKTLTVCNCNQLKVIVSDVGDETVDEITFIQLECLKLECLPSIASFCSAKHKFKFPCLIDIAVYQCPSMEFFSKGVSTTPLLQRVRLTEAANTGEWLGDLNSTISFCYRKMVGLCGLQQSKVSEHSNLGNRWNAELPVEFLCELESLVIDEIAFSSYAVPSKLLESLNELKKLEVSNCEELEEVFDVQMGSSAECGHTDFLSKLKRFQLINLPRLRNIWNEHPQGILNFKQLNSLKVHHCSSLKTIFTPSMAEGLVQLQDVEVKYCNSVEEIISKGAGNEAIDEVILPLLQSIMLESLPALLSLNGGSELLKCPSLEKIEIVDCPTTFTSTFLRELQSNAFDGTTEAKVLLPTRLKHLKVSLVKIEKIWYNLGMSSFIENLTILNIDGCSNLEYLFSSSVVLNCLIHVKSLEVSNCKSMKEILQMEKLGNIVLLNLELVKLKNLQQLTRFCSGNLIECNGLIELSIEDCPELGGLISNSANSNNSTTLFDEKVKFPNIERLNIVGVDGLKLIWGNELQQDSFCKLNHLFVKDAKQLMRIFPPSLLRKFKNLEKLFVHGCDVIEGVFDTKAVIDMEERGGVAVSQLKKLRVYNNPNLKHVWNEDPKRILSFHNLNSAKIRGCPSLKSVFPSSITRDLLVLEKLDVRDSAVEEIVAVDEEQIEGATMLNFPQLKVLVLKKLPKLDRLFPRTHASEWPALQKICIIQCYRFQQPTLSFKKIFPNLDTLALNGNEVKRVRESQFPVELFQKLKVLKLDYFDEKSAVFPYDLLRSVHNLETLVVSHSKFKLLFPPPVLLSDKNYPLIPTRMCHLNLLWLPNMKAMCNEVLQALERLYVRGCDSLIILAPSSASFESLVSLVIDECNGLVSLVTCSVAKRLSQLEELRIRRCNKLKVIVSDEADETTNKICFSKLQTLELDCLPSLTCFCSVNCKFQFPCLTEVVVNQCPNMEFFSQGASNTTILETVHQKNNGFWLGNLNSTIHFLYKKMVGFCGMRHLKLSEFSNLKDRWHNELPAEFLYELKSLEIDEAVFSSYAIPSNLLESLNKLEELEVNNCELLEEVFYLEGLSDQAQAQRGMLSKLNRFHLINLPSLTRVWNEHPLLNFKHLNALKVDNCSSLRMIFTPSMTRVLVQLQEIEVTNCVSVKEIVSDGQEEAETDQIISFPQLNSLVFNSLPKLTTFHSGRDIVQCPSLQKITSVGCPKIDLFTFSAHDEGTLIFFGKVICSSLKELRVDWSKSIKKIWDGQLAAARELFCSLKVLELKHFPTDYSFLPSNFLETMSPNLEEFIVSDASFGELFSQEVATYNDEESSTQTIPLRQLTLSKLPLLSHLIKDQNKRGSLVPHLEALEVGECTKLTILVPSFCSFQNLKTLTVSKCHGLLYLITPSTARSLSQLTRFEIAECEMLDEIVGSEGDEIEAEIGLSRLKHLELHCLSKLKRFCSGNAAFSFPCLEEVTVRECPEMDYFVEGELSTPNLESVLTTEDESEWCWEGNLNATIQKLFNKTITGVVEEH